MMDLKTINQVIKFSVGNNIRIIDLTGGAPEINSTSNILSRLVKKIISISSIGVISQS